MGMVHPLTFLLRRVSSLPDGMTGVLMLRGIGGDLPLCVTLEDPWNQNRVGASCIMAGAYLARKFQSTKFGEVFALRDVPFRSGILIHPGNSTDDTQGCILLGQRFTELGGRVAISESRAAVEAFHAICRRRDEITIVIEDCWGGSTILTH